MPGIIDDEQRTGETFNVRDYLVDPGQQDTPTPPENSASAPAEYETADGFMSSFLLSTERDKIDTTNEYGTFYRVVYEASLEGYRNSIRINQLNIKSTIITEKVISPSVGEMYIPIFTEDVLIPTGSIPTTI